MLLAGLVANMSNRSGKEFWCTCRCNLPITSVIIPTGTRIHFNYTAVHTANAHLLNYSNSVIALLSIGVTVLLQKGHVMEVIIIVIQTHVAAVVLTMQLQMIMSNCIVTEGACDGGYHAAAVVLTMQTTDDYALLSIGVTVLLLIEGACDGGFIMLLLWC